MKSEIKVALGILHAGINTRVSTNAVGSNGKVKINAVANGILRIQRVDGTTLYDSFELSINTVDQTSMFKLTNVNISQAINNNNDVAVTVYSKSEADTGLNLTADNFNT